MVTTSKTSTGRTSAHKKKKTSKTKTKTNASTANARTESLSRTATPSATTTVIPSHGAVDSTNTTSTATNSNPSSVDHTIVNNIRNFFINHRKPGRCTSEMTQANHAIISACMYGLPNGSRNVDNIRKAIGVTKRTFYNRDHSKRTMNNTNDSPPTYSSATQKKYSSQRVEIMIQSIKDFCHSDDGSQIDSNSRKKVNIKLDNEEVEEHIPRVWKVKTIKEQYELFCQSGSVDQYSLLYPDTFQIPSLSMFLKYRCKCVSTPVI